MPKTNDTSFSELFRAHPIPMWVYDLSTLAFRAVNTAAVVHYGYSQSEFLAMTIADLRPAEDLPRLYANLKTAPLHTLEKSGVWRHRKKDGSLIEVEISSHPISYDGHDCKFVLAHDVTERIAAQKKIVRLNRGYAVLSGINSAIVRIRERGALFKETCRLATMEGGFVSASIALAGADGAPGLSMAQHAGRDLPARPEVLEDLWIERRALEGKLPLVVNDIELDGSMAPFSEHLGARDFRAIAVFPLIVGQHAVGVLTLLSDTPDVFDADELKILNELVGDLTFALLFLDREDQINYPAHYDVMTALPNRRRFQDCLLQLLHPGPRVTCVVLINLDRFAQLNDALGRNVGDALLARIARRLDDALPESCNVARIGGDTFALTLVDLARAEDAADVLRQTVFDLLDRPFDVEGQEVRIATHAGLAVYPGDGDDAETLIKHASAALKNAKASDERYLYYAPRMNAALTARLALEQELQGALDKRQFVLHYQPRVDIASGQIVSAEALIRWAHPLRGLVGPLEFIGLAEENGLIRPIGNWVIDAVCAQLAAWQAGGAAALPVSINLSAVQCAQADLLDTIAGIMAGHGVDRKLIEFELTETAVMTNPDEAARNLRSLKTLGVRLSLDDFGTGYSSLAQLKRFPFDFVKIDRSFVAGLAVNPEDKAIASAIIAMAHSLGLKVVAEGVETAEQLAVLRRLRCDEMQGYYFSRPVPADEFKAMLGAGKQL